MGELFEPLHPCWQISAVTADQLGLLLLVHKQRQAVARKICSCKVRFVVSATLHQQLKLRFKTGRTIPLPAHQSYLGGKSFPLSGRGHHHYSLFPMVMSHLFTGVYSTPVQHLTEWLPESGIQRRHSLSSFPPYKVPSLSPTIGTVAPF